MRAAFLIFLLIISCFCFAQHNIGKLEQQLIDRGLVDIQTLDASVAVSLKYSTADNFIKEDVYGDLERAYLQPMAAQKLLKAQQALKKINPNYHLLVYDGARPRSVTIIFWKRMSHLPPNRREDFVADPKQGSIHNFGCAVDLTIADQNNKPLDMGTIFDFFGQEAEPRRETQMLKEGKITEKQLQNRRLLRNVMTQAGFTSIITEWWHYNALPRKQAKLRFKVIE